jgi:hypothetical protein
VDELEFNSRDGRKPQTEARRYVYRVLATVLVEDPRWFYEGIEQEPDRRRLKKAMAAVRAELLRKGET